MFTALTRLNDDPTTFTYDGRNYTPGNFVPGEYPGMVTAVQALWKDFYNWPDFPADGSQWDKLFADGETLRIGNLEGRVMFSPGHTLASITYVIGDAAFVHDTLFMPDSGTARCDFPGGSAPALWHSIQRILALPDDTRLFTGHDYRPNGREARWESTVAEQRAILAGFLEALVASKEVLLGDGATDDLRFEFVFAEGASWFDVADDTGVVTSTTGLFLEEVVEGHV